MSKKRLVLERLGKRTTKEKRQKKNNSLQGSTASNPSLVLYRCLHMIVTGFGSNSNQGTCRVHVHVAAGDKFFILDSMNNIA